MVVIATGSDNANRYFRVCYAGIPCCCAEAASRPPRFRAMKHGAVGRIGDDIWAYLGWDAAAAACCSCPKDMNQRFKCRP